MTNRHFIRILSATLAVAVLWGIGFSIIGPHYWTMDDVQMSREAAGRVITTAPEPRLQFTHVAIGHALVRLHEALPGTAWYGVYLLAVHFLAQTTLLYALLLRTPSRGHVVMFAGWFGTVGLTFLNRLQFTMTAFMAGMAGGLLILVLFDTARRSETDEPLVPARPTVTWWAGLIWGASLVLLCSMIRWRVLFMVAGMLAPLGLWTLLRVQRRERITLLAFSAALLVVCVGARMYDRSDFVRGAEWLREDRERLLTNEFIDYHAVPYNAETQPIFDEVGWSENDFAALMWGWWSDKTVFSPESLEDVLEHSRTNWSRFAAWEWVAAAFLQSREFPVLVAAGLITLLVTFRPDVPLRNRWVVVASVAVGIGAWIYLAATKQRVPPWVVVPIGTGPLFVALAVGGPTDRTSKRIERTWYRLVLTACLLLAGWWGWQEHRYHVARSRFESAVADDWRALEPKPGELFLYAVGSRWFPPVLAASPEPDNLAIVFVAAPQRTAVSLGQRERHGIDGDLVTALIEHDDVYLVCDPELRLANEEPGDLPRLPDVLRQYAREHHGVDLRYMRRYVGPTLIAVRADPVRGADVTSPANTIEQAATAKPGTSRIGKPDATDHSSAGASSGAGTSGAGGAGAS